MHPRRLAHARRALALLRSLRPLGYGCDPARHAQIAASLLAPLVGEPEAVESVARADAEKVANEALKYLRYAVCGLPSGTEFGRALSRAIIAAGTGIVAL